jgi:NAD(P)-dependent dehydrogenase (short-subunit alcohol dehydrogenase family)
VEEHVNVNAIGPYLLFQASVELLEQRAQYGSFAYGASKAMAHYTSRRIHFSHEDIISFVVDPG